jgi:hypothetical protein
MASSYQLTKQAGNLIYRMVDMGPPPGLSELSTYGRPPASHSREERIEDDDMPNQDTHFLRIANSGLAQWSWPFADVEEMSYAVL